MILHPTRAAALAAAAALLALTPGLATAKTAHPPAPRVITNKVVAPFNLALHDSRLYVADGGTATVSRVKSDGSLVTVAQGPAGGDVAGLDVSRDGRYLAYSSTEHPAEEVNANGAVTVLGPHHSSRKIDVAGYEAAANPDKINQYGVSNPSACVRDALTAMGAPVSYTGAVDSHPYSLAAYGHRSWLLADAGGNDLLSISRRGKVSTVAVLPAQPAVATAEAVAALKLPACVVGVTYRFEPVPTDVEVGHDGYLYVTTLAGGPAEFGPRSSVYRVNPRNGHLKLLITGLAGATNLALGRDGEIYVAEFYAGKVAVIRHGKVASRIDLPGVVSVESSHGRLLAGTFAGGPDQPGTIVEIRHGRVERH
ncbi:MAG: hypothetical protein JWP61_1731 [Friedmanniella sp.]|jgi:dipeptidyl aminopeptidase/acylaminoacyl peptidase|nr:hypothetical protein [Friedmanniella sp.]